MSWMKKYLAPFRDQADGTADDPLGSGAGAGEQLHPDQDNAPALDRVLGAMAEAEANARRPFTREQFRKAALIVYPGHPHALAAADRAADWWEDPEISLTTFEESVTDNLLAHLSRS